jgi:hypothetical protein
MKQDIIEGNKLIAEFMQLESRKPSWSMAEQFNRNSYWIPVGVLEYHTSWDWLMPVVEKIESLGFESGISSDATYFKMEASPFDVVSQADNSWRKKIETVWEAVIQFIQWYNQSK